MKIKARKLLAVLCVIATIVTTLVPTAIFTASAAEDTEIVFALGANGTAYSSKTVTIGDKTYVMPDVTATVSGKIGSKTVNGTTVYYPITEMYTTIF